MKKAEILAPKVLSGFISTIKCCSSPLNIDLLFTTPCFKYIGTSLVLLIAIKNDE